MKAKLTIEGYEPQEVELTPVDDTPDRTGQYLMWTDKSTIPGAVRGPITESKNGKHWYGVWLRDYVTEISFSIGRATQLPPKPTTFPPGKRLTGKAVDVRTCGPDVQWHCEVPDTGQVYIGPITNPGPNSNYRWGVEDIPTVPKGFVVWHEGITEE